MSYTLNDTIAALATPFGYGGIGVIRISGPKSIETVSAFFKPSTDIPLTSILPNTIVHGHIFENEKIIDEVLVSFFKKPHSYTSEDTVEISAHGSPVILDKILHLCISCGARLAKSGEFTFRAFMNGKLSLSQAEAVCDVIYSKTNKAAELGISILLGNLSDKIKTWKSSIIDLVAQLEVCLDHSQEEMEFVSKSKTAEQLEIVLNAIDEIMKSSSKSKFIREGVRIVIAGKPNVGKSSLLNALLARDRAIVCELAGTTRDIIEENLDIKGIPVIITDTAGLRATTNDPIEEQGHKKSIVCLKNADIVLWMFDGSHAFTEEDVFVGKIIKENFKGPVFAIINKCDLDTLIDKSVIKTFEVSDIIDISCTKNKGLEKIESSIYSWFVSGTNSNDESMLLNVRHFEVFSRTKAHIGLALEAVQKNLTEDLVLIHLKDALNSLGEITGETTTEDVLDRIFSKFCIGK